MYFKGEPLYPFGQGLSYTAFQYSNLNLGNMLGASSSDVKLEKTIARTR